MRANPAVSSLPNNRRQCLVLILALAVLAAPALAEGQGNFALRWPERVYAWRYNPDHEPAWLGKDEALATIREMAAAWEACGVTLPYEGLSDRPPGLMDAANVIGWKEDGRAYSAWTSWAARRSGQAIEADVTLYANIFADYRRRGVDARLELRKSIAHELGHVLGLGHSVLPGDAMTVKLRTRPEWRLPSPNDIARCRENYPAR